MPSGGFSCTLPNSSQLKKTVCGVLRAPCYRSLHVLATVWSPSIDLGQRRTLLFVPARFPKCFSRPNNVHRLHLQHQDMTTVPSLFYLSSIFLFHDCLLHAYFFVRSLSFPCDTSYVCLLYVPLHLFAATLHSSHFFSCFEFISSASFSPGF